MAWAVGVGDVGGVVGPLPDAVFTNAPTLSAEDLAAQLTRLRHHLE
jgi:hypothetical protein